VWDSKAIDNDGKRVENAVEMSQRDDEENDPCNAQRFSFTTTLLTYHKKDLLKINSYLAQDLAPLPIFCPQKNFQKTFDIYCEICDDSVKCMSYVR